LQPHTGPTILVGFGDSQLLKTPADALQNSTAVAAGNGYTCAIKSDGHVTCWSPWVVAAANVPGGLGKVKALVAGFNHVCAMMEADSTLRCWGSDYSGQITGQPSDLGAVKSVGVGGAHTCALAITGDVRCWGDGSKGQVNVPSGLSNVSALVAGEHLRGRNFHAVVNVEGFDVGSRYGCSSSCLTNAHQGRASDCGPRVCPASPPTP